MGSVWGDICTLSVRFCSPCSLEYQDPTARLDPAFLPVAQTLSIYVLLGFSIAVMDTMTKSNLRMDERVYLAYKPQPQSVSKGLKQEPEDRD